MEWYWILLIVIAGCVPIAGAVLGVVCRKKKTKLSYSERDAVLDVSEVAADEIDESRLCEIDDTGVSDRVKSLMPDLIKTEISAGLMVTTASKTVYKVILPASTKLASAGSAGGLLSGMGAGMAAGGVGALISSSVTGILSAASMVVGQYYMTQVNIQLKKIAQSISEIGEFQDNEFKSRVFALNAQVGKSAMFRAETLGNARLRAAEISKLDALEHECISLLGQAALMIGGYTERTDFDYDRYIRAVAEVQQWHVCSRILLQILYEIADLKFALNLGAASREQCLALVPVYVQQAEETQRRLTAWHKFTTEKLGVRLEESKRRRKGLDRALHFFPGLFKKDLKYRDMPASTVALIESQIDSVVPAYGETTNRFDEPVELIVRDGRIYYLLEEPKK